MSHEPLISRMRSHRGPEAASLDEYFAASGVDVFHRMADVARSSPGMVDDAAVDWAMARAAESPGSVFAILVNVAAKAEPRRPAMLARARTLLEAHPQPVLHSAGYWFHEFHYLLDEGWLAAADRLFDRDPEGGWGIFEAASMYERELITPGLIEAFERRRAAMPLDYFVSMVSLARHQPELLDRVLKAFPDHPPQAVEGVSFAAKSEGPLQTPEVVAAMLRHFDAAAEKAWDFFDGTVRTRPELFDDALLEALTARTGSGPGRLFEILRHLMDVAPDRSSGLMDRYVALVRRHPEKGVHSARYAFQGEDLRRVRPDLVKAVCAGFAQGPYYAYEFLWDCAKDRPELIGPPEVEAALKNIEHATNRAFGFFNALLKLRPEFTRECTLALFESLAREPVNRAFVRDEEIQELIAISEAAYFKTGLESALREPPRVGSRRARALMAIMFRQKLRARRHVLFEALRYAARIVLWRQQPSEKFSPVWDFVMFIIDNSGDDAVSTAAAERFLEGAFQLHYLCTTAAEHEKFLRHLDTGYPPAHPFPPGTEFLEADADLAHLYRLVLELGRRFGAEPRILPLAEFAGRKEAAESERRVLREQAAGADGPRRKKLAERLRSLERQIASWNDPAYLRAFGSPEEEQTLSDEARSLLKREKKDLAKQLRDALRAEAIRIAVAAVDRSRLDLYRSRLKDALGREVDLTEVEPKILPAFLWFQAISGLRNNTKYLRRLIEDRIAKRPHEWLRTEPDVLRWAEAVQRGQPQVVLGRWRAPYSKEFQYRPKDALAEKRRRIKADLAQARGLLEKAGAKGIGSESYDELAGKLAELKAPPPAEEPQEGETKQPRTSAADPAVLAEIEMNLERVRLSEATPDSDFEGRILLTVETDPFEILFMGEYGFASCLSLRGSNAWSAVSNAIDIDKTIIWAKEPGGNVVGRRLLALTPGGILVFRTYTNRHGLALDRVFDEFVEEYAAHCGTKVTHGGHAGPLLSDRWYDDGSI
jgi:hypothetical protein